MFTPYPVPLLMIAKPVPLRTILDAVILKHPVMLESVENVIFAARFKLALTVPHVVEVASLVIQMVAGAREPEDGFGCSSEMVGELPAWAAAGLVIFSSDGVAGGSVPVAKSALEEEL